LPLANSQTLLKPPLVTNTNDSGPGSLRDALAIANDGDTIDATGVSGTILLTSGQLNVDKDVIISGPGANNLAVDGNAQSRVFYVNPGKTVTIDAFTVRNSDEGGGIYNYSAALTVSNCILSGNSGGAVVNWQGALTVQNCSISGNYSGGIWNFNGTLTVSDCTVSGNSGPGIYNYGFNGGATATITNCTISGNSGGGINSGGHDGGATLTISNSSISGNSASIGGGICSTAGGGNSGASTVIVSNSTIGGNSAITGGGGIYNAGYNRSFAGLSVSNSTISDNSAASGGAIENYNQNSTAMLEISSTTFSGNSASVGGGIYNDYSCCGNATVSLQNTILNAGAAGENIFNNAGTITSLGYNLSSDNGGGYLTATGDQINTDPSLGPLEDNGGPTFTHALLPGSPATDAGDPNFTPPPFYDQRGPGFDRVVNSRIDIGSFEVQTQIHLRASGRKVGGINTVRLLWSGATSASIDVYRNGALIVTTANDGSYRDSTGDTGRARYTYRVCEAGTDTCSNSARVTFRQ
jgi:hypothetical protein